MTKRGGRDSGGNDNGPRRAGNSLEVPAAAANPAALWEARPEEHWPCVERIRALEAERKNFEKAYNDLCSERDELEARLREADGCLEKLGITWNGHAYIGFGRETEEGKFIREHHARISPDSIPIPIAKRKKNCTCNAGGCGCCEGG